MKNTVIACYTKFLLLAVWGCFSIYTYAQTIDSTRIDDPKYQAFLKMKELRGKVFIDNFEETLPTPKRISSGELPHYVEGWLNYDVNILQGEERQCYVYFEIDTLGKTFNHQIALSTGIAALDKEALRVVKYIDFNPAYSGSKPVYSDFQIPICFKLQRYEQQRYFLLDTKISIEYKHEENNDVRLTESEGQRLNVFASKNGIDFFDFVGKKVAFFNSNGGRLMRDKNYYFSVEGYGWPSYLYIFTEEQKQRAKGYDAAIVYGSKRLDKTKAIIRQIRKQAKE